MKKNFLKVFSVVMLIMCVLFSITACSNLPTQEDNNDNSPTIKYPIDKIELSSSHCAMPVGGEFTIHATISPTYTDDTITWSSTNEDVLIVDNEGLVKVVGVGDASIVVKATNGDLEEYAPFRIMHEYDYNYVNKCKSVADKAVLTIKNECYNTFLGITTKSETKTFTATIFKNIGSTYYFITGFDKFQKFGDYQHQRWYAIDCNGVEYSINKLTYEKDYALHNNSIAIGCIRNAKNVGVLPITSKPHYFADERLYVKNNDTYSFSVKYGYDVGSSPIPLTLEYSDHLYGSPVLDCNYNFVGFVMKEDLDGKADFVATWHMDRLINEIDQQNKWNSF